jgi:hypothetical protein
MADQDPQNTYSSCNLCKSAWKADTLAMVAPLLLVSTLIGSVLFTHSSAPWKMFRQRTEVHLSPAARDVLIQTLRTCAPYDPLCKAVVYERFTKSAFQAPGTQPAGLGGAQFPDN